MNTALAPSTSPSRWARRQGVGVDEQRLGRRLLGVHHRTDLGGDLRLDVVALVQHERDPGRRIETATAAHLPHDPEQLERVGGPDHQVVVGVEPRVEVEAAELAEPQQHRHDELDVRARGVVAGVEHHQRLGSERGAVGVRGAPVGDVHRVEGRLEQLVLEQHPLIVPEPLVHLRQRLGEALLAGDDVVLAGVVGAVGEPQLQVPRAGDVHDVDALQQVVERLAPDAGVGVGDRAELVVVVLEDVGVDRPDPHAELGGVLGQLVVVVHLVPRDVQRHARRRPGERVHLGGVGDLLERITRYARLGEHLEPRAGVPERPRRQLDVEVVESVGDALVASSLHSFLAHGRWNTSSRACICWSAGVSPVAK